MNRLSVALIAAISTIGLTGVASAADMPVKAPKRVVEAAFNWTGFYIGANAGYGRGKNQSGSIEALDPASALFVSFDLSPDQFANPFRHRGWRVGGQAGYNLQISRNWVAGVEADIQYADVRGDGSNVLFLGPTFPFTVNTERKLEWFGTVRGRLGYLVTPDLLLYGTGGLAYGKTSASGSILNSPPPGSTNSIVIATGDSTFVCAATGPA